jgi:hypothetical protein
MFRALFSFGLKTSFFTRKAELTSLAPLATFFAQLHPISGVTIFTAHKALEEKDQWRRTELLK